MISFGIPVLPSGVSHCAAPRVRREREDVSETVKGFISVLLSASSSSHYHTVSFNTLGNTNLQDLASVCQLIEDSNLTAEALFQIIVDFLSSQTEFFFTFLCNKLVAN